MTFPSNTYIVLDIPLPFADEVLALRRRHRDFFRWSLVAETTVSGSSGTGPIAEDEDDDRVCRALDRLAAETAPIAVSFGPVRRFPGTDVFYLSFIDEAQLRALHERILASGLRFTRVPFPYLPHVTLCSRSPISDDEAAALITTPVPPGEFMLESLSLYQLVQRPPPTDRFETLLCLLHRAHLAARG